MKTTCLYRECAHYAIIFSIRNSRNEFTNGNGVLSAYSELAILINSVSEHFSVIESKQTE